LIRANLEINNVPFKKILYCYSILQEAIEELADEMDIVQLHEGFPDETMFGGKPTLVVLDDMMMELRNDDRLAKYFTKMRHKNVSTLFITQNFYFNSQYATTVSRNAQYIVLFPNPRDSAMIDTLGRQVYPNHKHFLSSAFNSATEKPFGYLFLDFKPDTPKDLRVRSSIFPGEQCYVYLPSS